MSNGTTVYQQLAARFEPSEHKTKTIGGTGLTYVDGETVISRLNDALGYDGWSFEVGQINVLENEVWTTGRLTVYAGERTIIREQAGGQIINRKRDIPARPYVPADGDRPEQPAMPAQRGEIIELSNDIKGAITDCLKKCATLVGVGLYLYDPDARREVADEMRAEKRNGGTRAQPASDEVDRAARMTGAPPKGPVAPTSNASTTAPSNGAGAPVHTETVQQRWARLVGEATAASLPTINTIKAIDPNACGENQLRHHADRLETRLREVAQVKEAMAS